MKKIFAIILSVLAISACSDKILDIKPTNSISDAAVWSDPSLIRAYHTALFNAIPHGFVIDMMCKTTDEIVTVNSGSSPVIALGTLTPDNVGNLATTQWHGGCNLNYWNQAYQYLRRINFFLEQMDNVTVTLNDKDQLISEARFLRAFIYFYLIERYGECPLVTKSYELGSEETFTSSSFEEVEAFIESEINAIMPSLPDYYGTSDSNFGHPTKAVCQALLSRMYLYAASPLFNPSNDKSRWNKAYDASKKFIETFTQYSLYPDYEKLFNQASGTANSEIIYARNFTSTSSHQFPINTIGRRYGGYGGWWGSEGVSKELLDDYDMINGEPAFIWNNGVKTINPDSGYDPQHPYDNRDPRMEMCILHDGSKFHGITYEMWVSSDGESWGYDNYHQSSDNPVCNQQVRKFMPPDDVPINWQEKYVMPWIHFRLAEIYLNFAEAAFELGKEDECREYVNKIRARVGMPGLPASVTGENLRARLYNERHIELVFEEHRYFDLRRWKIASEVLNRPGHGIKITLDKATGVKTYEDELLLDRKFYDTMYFLPIATEEILRNNGALQQTSTWR